MVLLQHVFLNMAKIMKLAYKRGKLGNRWFENQRGGRGGEPEISRAFAVFWALL